MSPRKSSTSSDRPSSRPRYLAVEVAGDQPFPAAPLLERLLLQELGRPDPIFRLIRSEGPRALLRVDHRSVGAARLAWNGPLAPAGPSLRTLLSYGTLRKGKEWLRHPRPPLRVGPL